MESTKPTMTRAVAEGVVEAKPSMIPAGAARDAPHTPGSAPGQWRPHPNPVPADPPIPNPALAAGYGASFLPGWRNVMPFTLLSAAQFRPAGPPPLASEAYTRDFNEVKSLGGKKSAARTPEQSQIARFWYEGSPQGWNRIARVVAAEKNLDRWDLARLLALANMAMADGFIAGWNTRYHYDFWRPVTAIRSADTDGNPGTEWIPRGRHFQHAADRHLGDGFTIRPGMGYLRRAQSVRHGRLALIAVAARQLVFIHSVRPACGQASDARAQPKRPDKDSDFLYGAIQYTF
jgi:hypothetical protein